MAVKINSIDDLHENLNRLPTAAIRDIEKRIADWLASGGSTDDAYIKQQFRYAENLINRRSSSDQTT